MGLPDMAELKKNEIRLCLGVEPESSGSIYELKKIAYELDVSTGVAVVTFNTPKNLNALRTLQVWEMFLILEHAEHDPDVKCLLWTGAGRAFNAGADWKGSDQWEEAEAALGAEVMEAYLARGVGQAAAGDLACKNLTLAFWDFGKPSVCAVNGLAVGGGANMALSNYHDYVICSDKAKFMWPFSRLGLTPELGSSFSLPAMTGILRAKELLMLNEWCSAQKACEIGLCNKVVPHEELFKAAMSVAVNLAASNGTALRLGKQLMHAHVGRDKLVEIMDRENEIIIEAFTSEETTARNAAAAKAAKAKKAKARL